MPTRTIIICLLSALTAVGGALAGLIIFIAQGALQQVKDNGEAIHRNLVAITKNQNDIKIILRYLDFAKLGVDSDFAKLDVDSEILAAFIAGQPSLTFGSTDDGSGKKYVRLAGVYDATRATMVIFRLVRGVKDRDEHIERTVGALHILTNRLISFSDIENEPASDPGDIPELDAKHFEKLYSYLFPSPGCSDNVPGCAIDVSEVHAALIKQGWTKGATVRVNGANTYRALVKEISGNPDFLGPA